MNRTSLTPHGRLALVLGIALAYFTLHPATPTGLAQATARPGITVSYAQIGGPSTGVDGRAYLPTTPAWVTVDSGMASCTGGRKIEVSARSRTGQIREIRLMVNATGPGTVTLAPSGCPSGSISATLDDGTVLDSGPGTITISDFGSAENPTMSGTFSWSPTVNGHPMPFRGIVVVPAPSH